MAARHVRADCDQLRGGGDVGTGYARAVSHTVRVVGPTGDTEGEIDVADGESVLAASVRVGSRAIPSGCHGGGCGICRIRVRSGSYVTGKMSRSHVSVDDEAQGIALACRTVAHGDLVVTPHRPSRPAARRRVNVSKGNER